MDASKFEFTRLLDLLCRSENDPQVRHFCGRAISRIEHDEYYGALEFKSDGVDVVFKEAQWMKPLEQIASAEELYVAAFHLHRAGHEDFCGYTGQLPNGLAFGDREEEVLQKMGPPLSRGGGGISNLLKLTVPRWCRYMIGDRFIHVQLDSNGCVEMVTLDACEPESDLISAQVS
jgi:hypothetical protein